MSGELLTIPTCPTKKLSTTGVNCPGWEAAKRLTQDLDPGIPDSRSYAPDYTLCWAQLVMQRISRERGEPRHGGVRGAGPQRTGAFDRCALPGDAVHTHLLAGQRGPAEPTGGEVCGNRWPLPDTRENSAHTVGWPPAPRDSPTCCERTVQGRGITDETRVVPKARGLCSFCYPLHTQTATHMPHTRAHTLQIYAALRIFLKIKISAVTSIIKRV